MQKGWILTGFVTCMHIVTALPVLDMVHLGAHPASSGLALNYKHPAWLSGCMQGVMSQADAHDKQLTPEQMEL